MELTSSLISFQGILTSVVKRTGDFRKIKYKGGNEQKISIVKEEIEKFFTEKTYLKDKELNPEFRKEIKDIVFLLVLNCEFDSELEVEDHEHLMNATPKLSKCLLTNLIIDLDLSEYLSEVLLSLPLIIINELLAEISKCLKNANPTIVLENTYVYIKCIIAKLKNVHGYTADHQTLLEMSIIMLQNITGINAERSKAWSTDEIYKHIGYTMLYLLKLIQLCKEDSGDNLFLAKLFDQLSKSISSVIQAVTVTVFCTWAEVHFEGQPLQLVVSGEAYHVIEKLKKYKPAAELVQMLGPMAKKPKELRELIQEASKSTIIAMIEKADENQLKWFRALINTKVLNDKKSMECLEKYHHLVTAEDVEKILKYCIYSKSFQNKKLILKCASNLKVSELSHVILKHFYNYGSVNNLDDGTIQEQLTVLLNKVKQDENVDEYFIKQIYLLVLQNAKLVLQFLYKECLNNCSYISCLKELFRSLKDIIVYDMEDTNMFADTLKNCITTESYFTLNCTQLFETLLEVNALTYSKIVEKLILPTLELKLEEKSYNHLAVMLIIYNSIFQPVRVSCINKLLYVLLEILSATRAKNLDDGGDPICVAETIKLIRKHIDMNIVVEPNDVEDGNVINAYYAAKLTKNEEKSFFEFNFGNYRTQEPHEFFKKFAQFIPFCITEEWISIASEMNLQTGFIRTLELFLDVMLLLTYTASNPKIERFDEAYRHYLQNYMSVIISLCKHREKNIEDKVSIAQNICSVLRLMSDDLKEEHGLQLTKLISDSSLKFLVDDHRFVCSMLAIKDETIVKALALRMLP